MSNFRLRTPVHGLNGAGGQEKIYTPALYDIYIYIKREREWDWRHSLLSTWLVYIYIYIYIYTNYVENNWHFLSTYFLVDPFIMPYSFYRIRWVLIDVFSIILYIPSALCPTLGHHQGRNNYKIDATFVFACKKNVCTVGVSIVYF